MNALRVVAGFLLRWLLPARPAGLYDRQLVVLALALMGVGLVIVASASIPEGIAINNPPFIFVKRHGMFLVVALGVSWVGVQVPMGGDGQVTLAHIVAKGTARKVRKLHKGQVLAGFAGAPADAFTLFERFEAKLEKHQGHLTRAAIELTKDWRTDRVLRRLEAMLAVADKTASLIITGNGDVLEPEHGIVAIGSGGAYAQSAAKALVDHTDLSAAEVVRKSLAIAGELCIYTNMNHTVEVL